MSNENLVTIIEGYVPFDLLRLSKDAFYDVVAEDFLGLNILEMNLSFVVVDGECAIRAEVTTFQKVVQG